MKLSPASGTLLLFALATSLTASLPSQSPSSAGSTRNSAGRPTQSSNSGKGARRILCKTPENASLCYWTHGRLSVYEGIVTYRIWKIGTHRLLGVFSGPSRYPARTDEDLENPEFPAELDKALEANQRRHERSTGTTWTVTPPVFADFEVCPLRPEEKGVRQPVCIESATKIFIQDDDY